jgi:hypothetical protein
VLLEAYKKNLRLCITNRPEVDILLEPLMSTSTRIFLHDEDGQKKAIADHISSVVYSDKKIMRWPEQDKELVTNTLSDRADGIHNTFLCPAEDNPHFGREEGQEA